MNRSVVVNELEFTRFVFVEGRDVERGIKKHGLHAVPQHEDLSRTEIAEDKGAVGEESLASRDRRTLIREKNMSRRLREFRKLIGEIRGICG